MLAPDTVIFTDLDGTLLDHHSYSWAAAESALAEIARRKLPLVFVTSKTRAEVELLRRKMGNNHPFITENGGGVFVPHGLFPHRIPEAVTVGHYHCLALARPYAEIVQTLEEIAAEAGVEAVGFRQMSTREVAENTGLDLREAQLARQREFDEPFFLTGGDERAQQHFFELARQRNLGLTRGGRFWHAFSGSDKGRAVKKLMMLYREARPGGRTRLRSLGLGDSENDLPLLAAVDTAILLPKPDGSFDAAVEKRLSRLTRGAAPGPAGWNEAVLGTLQG